jgi:polyphosphate kinase
MPRRVSGKRKRAETSNGSLDSVIADGPPSPEELEAPSLDLPELTPELYINRELSWLAFNSRVLAEVIDEKLPLLERVKFLSIFSSNLDEFFMIRVAGVKRKIAAGIGEPGPDGQTPTALYGAIRKEVTRLFDQQCHIYQHQILPALAGSGIQIRKVADLSSSEQERLRRLFERDVFPILTPQAIDRARRFPHISNESLNLIVVIRSGIGPRFARIKIPAVLPRLVRLPDAKSSRNTSDDAATFVWLEDLVASHLDHLFPGHQEMHGYPFHITRDSDIEVDEDDEDAHDLISIMRELLSERTFGSVVRLMVDATMPEDVLSWLSDQLGATDRETYVVDGPCALENLRELTRLERPDLKDPPCMPVSLARSLPLDEAEPDGNSWGTPDIFAMLRQRDVLVHFPYQSFNAVSDFLKAASTDPHVVAIKQTLYRIGNDSPLIPALIEARDDDTQVAVLVELKARFDEESNISWAQQLEHHGVHVAYGVSGLKTHCKLTLVVRRETDGLRRYVHLATGNYNAATARLYEDIGIFTSREDVAHDVTELFNVLTGYSEQDAYRKLWVAPAGLRNHFLVAIAREIASHKQTGKGRLFFKMNALVDRELIRALYAASQAGVQVDLVVRGACCLRPGVPGFSENIRVRSIIGRFLEHSRLYYFHNGDDDRLYLGSADLMERNLDRRVEVVFPVEDTAIKAHLRDTVIPAYLADNVNAWELLPNREWQEIDSAANEPVVNVQETLAQFYASNAIVGEPLEVPL